MTKTRHSTAKPSKKTRKPSQAERADRHVLYQKAVQDTGFEFDFVDTTFKRLRGRRARLLREDFCGTAAMCCEWVRQRRDNRAIGVDLDPDVLTWGREHNLAELTPAQRRRVQLIEGNVLAVAPEPVDLLLAMNFSYQCFKDRATLRRYFERARAGLADDGVLIMDAFGGYDAYREMTERTDHKKFTYIWDQHHYDPVTGHMTCHIHFAFPDGSKMKNAFSYEWRLWSLPELQELLYEAGFQRVIVYWQGTEEGTNEGNGVFEPAEHGDADPAWICFISAEK